MTTLPQTTNIRLPRPIGGGTLAAAGATPHQAQSPVLGMSAGDVWRVIRANTWLIVISLAVSLVLGGAANWYLLRNFARYTAKGYVKIADRKRGSVVGPDGVQYSLDTTTLQVDQRTQAQLLRTDTLFNEVLLRPAIRETKWFQQFLRQGQTGAMLPDIAAAKYDLDDRLSISPLAETKLIEIQFAYSDPGDCRTIINELVDQHLNDLNLSEKMNNDFRTQDLNSTKYSLQLRDRTLADQISQNQKDLGADGISVMPGRVSPSEQELAGLTQLQAKFSDDYNMFKSQLDATKAGISRGDDPSEVERFVIADGHLAMLHAQVDKAQSDVDAMGGLGEKSSYVQMAQKSLMSYQQKLDDYESELRSRLRISVLMELQTKVSAAAAGLAEVNDRISVKKGALGQLDYKIFTLLQQKDEQKTIKDQMELVEKQLEDAKNDSRSRDIAGIQWANKPEKPDIPSFPRLWITLGVSVFIGLAFSLGLAFARELMDTTVRSPRDIQRVGQMNLLGMIPHEDDDPQVASVPLPLVIFQAPTSMIAEQFRQVRTRLQHATSLDTTRSILVTSPGPGDGKTIVAANLAAGLALNGRRILLVDSNFRRPQLHKIFNVENDNGFSKVLASPESLETAVSQTSVPNLDVLPTGPKPANPTELMESQLLIDFIEKALDEYDHVIFDTGPLLFVSETVALAPRVDGVVTVVRARTNSRGLLQRMRDALRQLRAEHLGVILNAVRSQGGGYYGRNIKTYYEYQNGHAH